MKAQFKKEQSDSGEFQRQEDAFREWISADGSTPYPAVASFTSGKRVQKM